MLPTQISFQEVNELVNQLQSKICNVDFRESKLLFFQSRNQPYLEVTQFNFTNVIQVRLRKLSKIHCQMKIPLMFYIFGDLINDNENVVIQNDIIQENIDRTNLYENEMNKNIDKDLKEADTELQEEYKQLQSFELIKVAQDQNDDSKINMFFKVDEEVYNQLFQNADIVSNDKQIYVMRKQNKMSLNQFRKFFSK